jgi:large subunit ribosomal protein L29
MTIDEMRELEADALAAEALKLREKIWKVRFQAKGEPVENPGELRGMKRDVARLLTIRKEKLRARASSAAASRAAKAGAQGETR